MIFINIIIKRNKKYSKPKTQITIKTNVNDDHIMCSIQDQGIGIKAQDLQHVYNNFFRSDALDHKQITGNGLGLTIVKKCADAIQASLEIKSDLNEGTKVTIIF